SCCFHMNFYDLGFDESLLARAEALAAADIASHCKSHPFKTDVTYHTMSSVPCTSSSSTVPISHPSSNLPSHHHHHHHHHLSHQTLEGDLLDHISSSLSVSGMGAPPDPSVMTTQAHQHHLQMGHLHQAMAMGHPHTLSVHNGMACVNDVESDPRELEAFAERFKQRRIKLGVTQADCIDIYTHTHTHALGCTVFILHTLDQESNSYMIFSKKVLFFNKFAWNYSFFFLLQG
uniref:POU class 4 homeobox 3 n=1 Tax=Sinocyclocheilus grahami TaxID=75366 RepID=A0A672RBK1_SINGR